MNYTISKVIHILELIIKDTSLINDDDFDMINKLCSQLNYIVDKD